MKDQKKQLLLIKEFIDNSDKFWTNSEYICIPIYL